MSWDKKEMKSKWEPTWHVAKTVEHDGKLGSIYASFW